MKHLHFLSRCSLSWRILFLVVALHVIVLLVFGSVTLLYQTKKKETFFEAPPPQAIQPTRLQYKVSLEKLTRQTQLTRRAPISVDRALVKIQVPEIVMPESPSSPLSQESWRQNHWETNLAFDQKLALPEVDIKWLFGKQVHGQRLGVIWDVSKSMHGYLPIVAKEVRDSFPDATIVLVSGSGITPSGTGQVFPLEKQAQFAGSKIDLHFRNSHYPEAQKLLLSLYSPKTFFIDARLDQATHLAFIHLISEEVDCIYWFADFQDPIDDALLARISEELLREEIQVFTHHPRGEVSGEKSFQRMAQIEQTLLLPSGGGQIRQALAGK